MTDSLSELIRQMRTYKRLDFEIFSDSKVYKVTAYQMGTMFRVDIKTREETP